MIYLAQPYSDPSLEVMNDRFEAALAAVAHLVRKNQLVYSPIVHFHSVAAYHDLPRSFEFWQTMNMRMLDKADQFFVLRLPGWESSKGLTAETTYAAILGMNPVGMVDVRG